MFTLIKYIENSVYKHTDHNICLINIISRQHIIKYYANICMFTKCMVTNLHTFPYICIADTRPFKGQPRLSNSDRWYILVPL